MFLMAGLDFHMTLTSPTDHGTVELAIFISHCHFNNSMFCMNVKYIYQLVGGIRLILGSPPIQQIQIDRAEVARCTLSVSCSIDLDYCVVFVDQVGVFLNTCLEL